MKKWFHLPLQEKLRYLTFCAGAVVFLSIARQHAGGFFLDWVVLGNILKGQFSESCFLDCYG